MFFDDVALLNLRQPTPTANITNERTPTPVARASAVEVLRSRLPVASRPSTGSGPYLGPAEQPAVYLHHEPHANPKPGQEAGVVVAAPPGRAASAFSSNRRYCPAPNDGRGTARISIHEGKTLGRAQHRA